MREGSLRRSRGDARLRGSVAALAAIEPGPAAWRGHARDGDQAVHNRTMRDVLKWSVGTPAWGGAVSAFSQSSYNRFRWHEAHRLLLPHDRLEAVLDTKHTYAADLAGMNRVIVCLTKNRCG